MKLRGEVKKTKAGRTSHWIFAFSQQALTGVYSDKPVIFETDRRSEQTAIEDLNRFFKRTYRKRILHHSVLARSTLHCPIAVRQIALEDEPAGGAQ